MKLKRLIAGLMTVVLLLGLMPGTAVAAGGGSFQDITDPNMAEAAEILRLLGVVDGTGGSYFNPGGALTRAEFCKLAVEIMGLGDQEPAQRNRTIFLDVGPGHWARGYINLASSVPLSGSGGDKDEGGSGGGDRLIMGVGNGKFEPDRAITCGEAVAMLVRILGYNNADVSTGVRWYDGYLGIAQANGLTDGLSLSGGSTISRGQSALLFKNMLFTRIKGANSDDGIYLKAKLNGSITENLIILSVDTPTGASTTTRVRTSSGGEGYQTARTSFPSALTGVRGKLVLDDSNKVLTILPEENDTIRRVSVMGSAEANKVPVTGGETLSVALDTPVWRSGDGEVTTYEKVWTNLYTGTPLVFCYGSDGKVAYIYMASASASSDTVMVARTKPNGTSNPFASLAHGDRDYQIYKNGVPATVADLRQYDVATYDSGAKIIYVSDLRLTGRYENAYPNPTAPSRIKMLGVEFKVLPGAVDDLSTFRPGENITLLLTSRGEVAGAVETSVARTNVVGVVSKISGSSAEVEPLTTFYDAEGNKVVFTGNPGLSTSSAEKMEGQLVTVTSNQSGQLNLHRLTSSGASGNLDVANRTLGGVKLAENVAMFERVGNSVPGRITFEQLTRGTVPSSRILYVGKDSTGKISTIVFDDVTGDQYTYGFSRFTSADQKQELNATIAVVNGDGDKIGLGPLICGVTFGHNAPIGIAASIETMNGSNKLAGSVSLTSIRDVSRASIDIDAKTVTIGNQVFPISDQVVSFNRSTGSWFAAGLDGLEAARAYADKLTVYYDKEPENGGKIRIVAVG